MKVLDLFSGIGGFSLAAHSQGFSTMAFCEIEPYAASVLRRHFPGVPVFDDVKELTADALAHAADQRLESQPQSRPTSILPAVAASAGVGALTGSLRTGLSNTDDTVATKEARNGLLLTAGFPCQDISYAGKGAGLDGARSGLFYEVARLIGELRPDYVLLENVAALLTRGLDAVLGTLASLGFDACWACVPACAVGAPHRRDRVWILAVPESPDSKPRLEAAYAHVLSRLTPFGDLSEGWPTATASDAWASDKERNQTQPCTGRVLTGKAGLGLGHAAAINGTWRTPNATDGDHGGPNARDSAGGLHLTGQAAASSESAGALNPAWVETLMGYPIGYTLPEGEPLVTLPTRWPAGLGAPQHEWEPPRLTTEKQHRASRLKCLGNSIVPQVAVLWMEAIRRDAR